MKTELAEFLLDGWDEVDRKTGSLYIPDSDLMQIHSKGHKLRFVDLNKDYISVMFYDNINSQGLGGIGVCPDCLLMSRYVRLSSIKFEERCSLIKYLPELYQDLPPINGGGALKKFRKKKSNDTR